MLQAMTSERNTLVEEMTLLKQQAGISPEFSSHKEPQQTVLWGQTFNTKAAIMHSLQILILIGYFLWEDHVWRSYRD